MPSISTATSAPLDIRSASTSTTSWETMTPPGWARSVEVQNPNATGGAAIYVSLHTTAGNARAGGDHEVMVPAQGSVKLVFDTQRRPGANAFLVCTPTGTQQVNYILRDRAI